MTNYGHRNHPALFPLAFFHTKNNSRTTQASSGISVKGNHFNSNPAAFRLPWINGGQQPTLTQGEKSWLLWCASPVTIANTLIA
jgi:hypothetical protein